MKTGEIDSSYISILRGLRHDLEMCGITPVSFGALLVLPFMKIVDDAEPHWDSLFGQKSPVEIVTDAEKTLSEKSGFDEIGQAVKQRTQVR